MSLMDPDHKLDYSLHSHVRVWGVIDLDRGKALIRSVCRRCGAHGEHETRVQADAFKAEHEGANNQCPHESEVKY